MSCQWSPEFVFVHEHYLWDVMSCHWLPCDLQQLLWISDDVFHPKEYFTLYFFLLFFMASVGSAVQPQSQQGFMMVFETQSQCNCLFESQQFTNIMVSSELCLNM